MKVRTSKQPKQAKPATQVKDLEPREDPKGGYGLPTGGTTSSLQSQTTLGDREDLLKRK